MKRRCRVNLYIRADAEVIERGKRYAALQGKSLSRLVEEHFLRLTEGDDQTGEAKEMVRPDAGIQRG